MESHEYTFVRPLEEGAYGAVYLCLQRPSSIPVAVKVCKHLQDEGVKRLLLREIKVLRALPAHPCVVRLLDAFRSQATGRAHLVFELMDRSLHQELDVLDTVRMPAAQLKVITFQLVLGLAHCHSQKVIHRDIKPANVLLSGGGTSCVAKLCDFGFARFVSGPSYHTQERLSTYVVTRWYRAPEILVGGKYGLPSDVWGLGCTLAEMATGDPLFPGSSTLDQLARIMRCFGSLPPTLVDQLLTVERLDPLRIPPPRSRTLQQRLPNIDSRLYDLIAACLTVDPNRRPAARDLLRMPFFRDIPRLLAGTQLEALLHILPGASRPDLRQQPSPPPQVHPAPQTPPHAAHAPRQASEATSTSASAPAKADGVVANTTQSAGAAVGGPGGAEAGTGDPTPDLRRRTETGGPAERAAAAQPPARALAPPNGLAGQLAPAAPVLGQRQGLQARVLQGVTVASIHDVAGEVQASTSAAAAAATGTGASLDRAARQNVLPAPVAVPNAETAADQGPGSGRDTSGPKWASIFSEPAKGTQGFERNSSLGVDGLSAPAAARGMLSQSGSTAGALGTGASYLPTTGTSTSTSHAAAAALAPAGSLKVPVRHTARMALAYAAAAQAAAALPDHPPQLQPQAQHVNGQAAASTTAREPVGQPAVSRPGAASVAARPAELPRETGLPMRALYESLASTEPEGEGRALAGMSGVSPAGTAAGAAAAAAAAGVSAVAPARTFDATHLPSDWQCVTLALPSGAQPQATSPALRGAPAAAGGADSIRAPRLLDGVAGESLSPFTSGAGHLVGTPRLLRAGAGNGGPAPFFSPAGMTAAATAMGGSGGGGGGVVSVAAASSAFAAASHRRSSDIVADGTGGYAGSGSGVLGTGGRPVMVGAYGVPTGAGSGSVHAGSRGMPGLSWAVTAARRSTGHMPLPSDPHSGTHESHLLTAGSMTGPDRSSRALSQQFSINFGVLPDRVSYSSTTLSRSGLAMVLQSPAGLPVTRGLGPGEKLPHRRGSGAPVMSLSQLFESGATTAQWQRIASGVLSQCNADEMSVDQSLDAGGAAAAATAAGVRPPLGRAASGHDRGARRPTFARRSTPSLGTIEAGASYQEVEEALLAQAQAEPAAVPGPTAAAQGPAGPAAPSPGSLLGGWQRSSTGLSRFAGPGTGQNADGASGGASPAPVRAVSAGSVGLVEHKDGEVSVRVGSRTGGSGSGPDLMGGPVGPSAGSRTNHAGAHSSRLAQESHGRALGAGLQDVSAEARGSGAGLSKLLRAVGRALGGMVVCGAPPARRPAMQAEER
ncbi:hypothetical protein HYH03_006065 [Edaphochlamys debaryana]|uniref:Protein kinase domain-containing protein n=1 Tax=Edaphochlamys debaryana TaxID=47281 RepID=A0A835Y4H4_9CHLO|nr:hypothetical protein HYH03_006065 [Edaphochlamys debaryana]|eukprot:KAG2495826.1 hypothetical protein HYH03_006065 [Edaphochlamys debaryana]